jgi:rubrerythrin
MRAIAMVSAYEIFGRAERIERAAAELYRSARAGLSRHSAERALFSRLEDEELQHAARVRLLAAHYRNEPRLFRLADGAEGRLDAIERSLRQLAAELVAAHSDADAARLRERLLEVEEHCSASHAEILADGADPHLRRFFEELARQDKAHHALLAAAFGHTAS